jgi:hypothetical protein
MALFSTTAVLVWVIGIQAETVQLLITGSH